MANADIQFDELPGWAFHVEEVSASRYRGTGADQLGHSVSSDGFDPDEVVADCVRRAKWCMQQSNLDRDRTSG
jgi:hypothetical protein